MSGNWKYQIRIDLPEKLAEAARNEPGNPELKPLRRSSPSTTRR